MYANPSISLHVCIVRHIHRYSRMNLHNSVYSPPLHGYSRMLTYPHTIEIFIHLPRYILAHACISSPYITQLREKSLLVVSLPCARREELKKEFLLLLLPPLPSIVDIENEESSTSGHWYA